MKVKEEAWLSLFLKQEITAFLNMTKKKKHSSQAIYFTESESEIVRELPVFQRGSFHPCFSLVGLTNHACRLRRKQIDSRPNMAERLEILILKTFVQVRTGLLIYLDL